MIVEEKLLSSLKSWRKITHIPAARVDGRSSAAVLLSVVFASTLLSLYHITFLFAAFPR